MICKGQRVRVEFAEFDLEGTALADCPDYACDPLYVRDDFDGAEIQVPVWRAGAVEIIPPEIVDTGEQHDAHISEGSCFIL